MTTSTKTNVKEISVLDFADLIQEMAYVAYNKIKKPTTYEVDDLIQEGNIAAMKAIESWDGSKGAKVSTWITTIVRNCFYDIIWYSYRTIDSLAVENFDLFRHKSSTKEDAVGFLDWIQSKFSYLEQQYIKIYLLEKQNNPEDFRIRVRKKLGINENVEDILRSSIKRSVQISKGN